MSLTFFGDLFAEDKLLALARAYEQATEFHRKHPDLDAALREWKEKKVSSSPSQFQFVVIPSGTSNLLNCPADYSLLATTARFGTNLRRPDEPGR